MQGCVSWNHNGGEKFAVGLVQCRAASRSLSFCFRTDGLRGQKLLKRTMMWEWPSRRRLGQPHLAISFGGAIQGTPLRTVENCNHRDQSHLYNSVHAKKNRIFGVRINPSGLKGPSNTKFLISQIQLLDRSASGIALMRGDEKQIRKWSWPRGLNWARDKLYIFATGIVLQSQKLFFLNFIAVSCIWLDMLSGSCLESLNQHTHILALLIISTEEGNPPSFPWIFGLSQRDVCVLADCSAVDGSNEGQEAWDCRVPWWQRGATGWPRPSSSLEAVQVWWDGCVYNYRFF